MALFQVIKYDGPDQMLIWKYPKSDMSTGSRLVVGPAQSALFVRGGIICDVLGPGSYVLSTANLPILSRLINLPFGGKSPFSAEVIFVNRLDVLDIKWGTARHIQLRDPVCRVLIPLRAFGRFGVRVTDPRRFLERLAGTAKNWTTQDLTDCFRGVVSSRIVEALSKYLLEEEICFLEANAHLSSIGEGVSCALEPFFVEYGIQLIDFRISSVNVPEGDQSVRKLREVLDRRHEMDVLRFSYQQDRSFDVLEAAAQNLGEGGNAAGFQMGAAFGPALSGLVRDAVRTAEQRPGCTGCGSALSPGGAFCPKCGRPVSGRTSYCTKCGAELQPGNRFCGKCGQAVPLERE